MSKTPGWKFAEGVALDIMKQDRQLISSRAIGMIAAEFDAATAERDCPIPPTTPAAARDALVAAAVDFGTPSAHRVQERYDALFAAVASYLEAKKKEQPQ